MASLEGFHSTATGVFLHKFLPLNIEGKKDIWFLLKKCFDFPFLKDIH